MTTVSNAISDRLGRVPRILLRLEGLAVFTAAIALYFHQGYGWIALVVFALAPDVTIGAYALGPRYGTVAYDAGHTYVLPVALAAAGAITGADVAVQAGLIWTAHIGGDRVLGYGLKYPTRFSDTHLQRV